MARRPWQSPARPAVAAALVLGTTTLPAPGQRSLLTGVSARFEAAVAEASRSLPHCERLYWQGLAQAILGHDEEAARLFLRCASDAGATLARISAARARAALALGSTAPPEATRIARGVDVDALDPGLRDRLFARFPSLAIPRRPLPLDGELLPPAATTPLRDAPEGLGIHALRGNVLLLGFVRDTSAETDGVIRMLEETRREHGHRGVQAVLLLISPKGRIAQDGEKELLAAAARGLVQVDARIPLLRVEDDLLAPAHTHPQVSVLVVGRDGHVLGSTSAEQPEELPRLVLRALAGRTP